MSMTETAAIVQTAVATWALVLGSIGACAATIYAVWTTLNQAQITENRRKKELNGTALDMIDKAVKMYRDLGASQQSADPIKTEGAIWKALGELTALRRVLEKFLGSDVFDSDLPSMFSDMIQRSFDAKAALDVMLPKEKGEAGLSNSQATLKSVEARMNGIDERVSKARHRLTELKIDGGRVGWKISIPAAFFRADGYLLRLFCQGASRARC